MVTTIKPGTSKAEIESRFGKADEVVNAAAGKSLGKEASGNVLYRYKKLDETYELWVNFDKGGKVIWSLAQTKDAKLFSDKVKA